MKTCTKKISILILGYVFAFSSGVFAQSEMVQLLNGGIKDFNTLGEAYITPFGKAFGTAFCGGWYNTAATHKLLGFDLTITVNGVMIPTEGETFDLQALKNDLQIVKIPDAATSSPTVFGQAQPGPRVGFSIPLNYTDPNTGLHFESVIDKTNAFPLPQGVGMKDQIGYNGLPLPMVNLSIGLIKGTEVMGRYCPTLDLGSGMGKLGMWGVGLKHDFKQWIPVVSALPFDASIMGAFTKISSSFSGINYYPTDYMPEIRTDNLDEIYNTGGQARIDQIKNSQKLEFSSSGFTTNLIVSKKLLMFTIYGSVGYFQSTFKIDLKGDYAIPEPFIEINPNDPYGSPVKVKTTEANVITDPISFDIKNSGLRAGAGLRIKILILTIHADYTYQNYSMATVGLGVNFR